MKSMSGFYLMDEDETPVLGVVEYGDDGQPIRSWKGAGKDVPAALVALMEAVLKGG